ncbi:hypothetical protein [Spirosoma koreense]
MNRFFVLYSVHGQYFQIGCTDLANARQLLEQIGLTTSGLTLGIYDAKTELFSWETFLQQQYDQMSLEEQGKLGHQIIAIAQNVLNQRPATPCENLTGFVFASR